mgnify:FL=1
MKKIITILSASFLLAFSALAETGMIGIKYGTGELDGTQNSYDDKRSGAGTIAARSASEDHEYGAIFLELNVPSVDGLSLGVEIIPLSATLTIDSSTTDSHLELSDYTTLYGMYSYDLGGVAAYAKVGYSQGDISNVTANFASTSVTSASNKLKGAMVGVGVQKELVSEFTARLEATYTDFDAVSVTTQNAAGNSVLKTGDADLTTFSVSLAKSF